ncbi:winged helix-turn-helix transcriptional regulator [Streptomyces sp. NPDC020817]|uniref:winged helix-turn-helix transcriptional regulator n=1 Tax=Streptomyces sp. NPDC020817 TaxID=3365095 RepID=UPI0037B65260
MRAWQRYGQFDVHPALVVLDRQARAVGDRPLHVGPARSARRLRGAVPVPRGARPPGRQVVRAGHRPDGAGPPRFGALLRRLEGVSPKVLTSTLRRLDEKGFVDRTV